MLNQREETETSSLTRQTDLRAAKTLKLQPTTEQQLHHPQTREKQHSDCQSVHSYSPLFTIISIIIFFIRTSTLAVDQSDCSQRGVTIEWTSTFIRMWKHEDDDGEMMKLMVTDSDASSPLTAAWRRKRRRSSAGTKASESFSSDQLNWDQLLAERHSSSSSRLYDEGSLTHTHTPRGEEEEETGAKSGLQRLLLAGHRKYRPAGEPHTQSSLPVPVPVLT